MSVVTSNIQICLRNMKPVLKHFFKMIPMKIPSLRSHYYLEGVFYKLFIIKKAGRIFIPAFKNLNILFYFILARLFLAAALFTFSVARSAAPNGLSFAKSTNIGAATNIDE